MHFISTTLLFRVAQATSSATAAAARASSSSSIKISTLACLLCTDCSSSVQDDLQPSYPPACLCTLSHHIAYFTLSSTFATIPSSVHVRHCSSFSACHSLISRLNEKCALSVAYASSLRTHYVFPARYFQKCLHCTGVRLAHGRHHARPASRPSIYPSPPPPADQPIRYPSLFSACQLSVALLARLPAAAAALLLNSHYTALCRLLINIDAPQAPISSRFTYVNMHYPTISSIQNQSVQRKRAKQENRHNLWDHHY